jgi:hypothetical protein
VLVAAAVCPHPPLLIPEALGAAGRAGHPGRAGDTGRASGEQASSAEDLHDIAGDAGDAGEVLRRVRDACFAAAADLVRAGPDLIVVVGGAPASAGYDGSAAGSLRDFGVPFVTGSGRPVLPLSLTVGAWLIRGSPREQRSGNGPAVRLQAVARDTPTAGCLELGARLGRGADRVAMLAMGDASARKAAGVPGAPDPTADSYDAELAAALAAADAGRLARLDPALDDELAVAGRAAWQVLAGATRECRAGGILRCAAAPFDVSYLVASWECSPRDS